MTITAKNTNGIERQRLELAVATLAAMTRAAKSIARSYPQAEKERMAAGTHTVDISVRITGDIVQGAPVESEAPLKKKREYTCEELLGAIALGMEQTEWRRMIRMALRHIHKALGPHRLSPTRPASELANAGDALMEYADIEADKCGLMATIPSIALVRAGALTGSPAVDVRGIVDAREVRIEVKK